MANQKDSEMYPKIRVMASIKKVVMCDKANLVFDDLSFSPEQYSILERWRVFGDKICITLEQVQANINNIGTSKKSMAQVVAETERK